MTKKKKLKKPADLAPMPTLSDQAEALAFEKGITPYNAAIVLGMSHNEALKFSEIFLKKSIMPNTPIDIAERMMITPRDLIVHLSQRAGLNGTDKSAKKVVSMVVNQEKAADFVEVEDFRTQLAYLQELIAFIYKAKEETAAMNVQPIFNISFNVLPENVTPEQADKIVQLSAS